MIELNATFLVAMLSFVVFILIMNAIFYRPVLNIIKKREAYISDNYNKAKLFDEETQKYNTGKQEKLNTTKVNCRIKIEQAIESAQQLSNKKILEQKEQTKLKIQSGKNALLQEKNELENELNKGIIEDLAKSMTEKLLKGVSNG